MTRLRAGLMTGLILTASCGGNGGGAGAGEPGTDNSSGGEPTTSRIDPTEGSAPRSSVSSNEPLEPGTLPAPPDVAAVPASAQRTASGLASRVLRAGSGTVYPGPTSRVRVHYTGWTTDGVMFDSSRTRGAPLDLPLSGVIAGWTEGLQLMVAGEERRFWIPAELAYGSTARGGRPAGMLVFDVELLAIDP